MGSIYLKNIYITIVILIIMVALSIIYLRPHAAADYEYIAIAKINSTEQAHSLDEVLVLSRNSFLHNPEIVYMLENNEDGSYLLLVPKNQVVLMIETLMFYDEFFIGIEFDDIVYDFLATELINRFNNTYTNPSEESSRMFVRLLRVTGLYVESFLIVHVENISHAAVQITCDSEGAFFYSSVINTDIRHSHQVLADVEASITDIFKGTVSSWAYLAEKESFEILLEGKFEW